MSEGQPEGSEARTEGSEGQPEWSECQPEWSEGQIMAYFKSSNRDQILRTILAVLPFNQFGQKLDFNQGKTRHI